MNFLYFDSLRETTLAGPSTSNLRENEVKMAFKHSHAAGRDKILDFLSLFVLQSAVFLQRYNSRGSFTRKIQVEVTDNTTDNFILGR